MALNYKIRLHEMRERAGLTLRQLSAETGISASELNDIERGKKDPRLSTVVILAKYFRVKLSDFINF